MMAHYKMSGTEDIHRFQDDLARVANDTRNEYDSAEVARKDIL